MPPHKAHPTTKTSNKSGTKNSRNTCGPLHQVGALLVTLLCQVFQIELTPIRSHRFGAPAKVCTRPTSGSFPRLRFDFARRAWLLFVSTWRVWCASRTDRPMSQFLLNCLRFYWCDNKALLSFLHALSRDCQLHSNNFAERHATGSFETGWQANKKSGITAPFV